MAIKRRKTKQIKLGNLTIGSDNPVYIQSMPKISLEDSKIFSKMQDMISKGCEIIRIAVKDESTAKLIGKVSGKVDVPLIADIHFDYKLALICIKEGINGIRLNPGNIYRESHVQKIIDLAKTHKIPVRIGVNSGSLEKYKILASQSWAKELGRCVNLESIDAHRSPEVMVKLALDYVNLLESMDFYEIMISIKSEDVFDTIISNRRIATLCGYPLHLGITATGLYQEAVIKSSIGIGSLLLDGIGDIIRVSITSDPITEIEIAQKILSGLHIRRFVPEIISCPGCSRAQIEVEKIANQVKERIKGLSPDLKIAIMGCEVNGPGEAKHADIGIAGGSDSVLLFKKGKKIRRVSSDKAVGELVRCIEEWDRY